MSLRTKAVALALLLVTVVSAPCQAADTSPVKDLFENALYGGLVGTLVGGACLAFTKKPGDHLNYLSIGAASGVLAGIGFTVAKQSRALVAVENGNVKFAMPTVKPELQVDTPKGHAALLVKADLLNGSF